MAYYSPTALVPVIVPLRLTGRLEIARVIVSGDGGGAGAVGQCGVALYRAVINGRPPAHVAPRDVVTRPEFELEYTFPTIQLPADVGAGESQIWGNVTVDPERGMYALALAIAAAPARLYTADPGVVKRAWLGAPLTSLAEWPQRLKVSSSTLQQPYFLLQSRKAAYAWGP